MIIYGAGMAGLLAARVLKRFEPEVRERQSSLPNNHAALLRFRTDACSKATGIPFRKVSVAKAVVCDNRLCTTADLATNNRYSAKVVGKIVGRSIMNLTARDRYIAPSDFVAQLAAGVKIIFNHDLGAKILERNSNSSPVISTIPMPSLMATIGLDRPPKFQWRKIWTIKASLTDCDVFQTLYYPEAHLPYYRASITGNELAVECTSEPFDPEHDAQSVLEHFGIDQRPAVAVRCQEYGKLTPLDDPDAARRFILRMTDQYRIYSLGRFATWRQLLLDDLVHDISVIEKLVECRDGYQRAIEGAKGMM